MLLVFNFIVCERLILLRIFSFFCIKFSFLENSMRVVDLFIFKSVFIEFINGKFWILVVDGLCNVEGLVVCVVGSIVDVFYFSYSFVIR